MADDVATQYEMLTGEPIELFFDQRSLAWGDDWQHEIDERLESAAFFIPVVTPRYLTSEACRRELWTVAQRAEAIGLKGLILPLYYVDVPSFGDGSSSDDVLDLVQRFQYVDWRDRRFQEVHTEKYRRGIWNLVRRLAATNQEVDTKVYLSSATRRGIARPAVVGAAQTVDRVEVESVLSLVRTLEPLAVAMKNAHNATKQAVSDIGIVSANKADFPRRRDGARALARRLSEPAERILVLGRQFASQVHTSDSVIRTLVEQRASSASESAEKREVVDDLSKQVQRLSSDITSNIVQARDTVGILTNLQNLSRNLRPVLRQILEGLVLIGEAKNIVDEWVRLIQRSGADGPDDSVVT